MLHDIGPIFDDDFNSVIEISVSALVKKIWHGCFFIIKHYKFRDNSNLFNSYNEKNFLLYDFLAKAEGRELFWMLQQ